MNRIRIHAQDPTEAVERAFFRIQHERMAGVPIANPALRVEAVGFQPWQGQWLGIVITPWCMSVLLVPASAEDWIAAAGSSRRFVQFPYGQLAFLASHEPELGDFQSCALFSPMDKFATQAQAVATARASMLALLAPPARPVRAEPVLRQAQDNRDCPSTGSGRTVISVRAEPVLRQAQDSRNSPSTSSGRTVISVRAEPVLRQAQDSRDCPSTGSGRTENASRRRFLGLGDAPAENTRA